MNPKLVFDHFGFYYRYNYYILLTFGQNSAFLRDQLFFKRGKFWMKDNLFSGKNLYFWLEFMTYVSQNHIIIIPNAFSQIRNLCNANCHFIRKIFVPTITFSNSFIYFCCKQKEIRLLKFTQVQGLYLSIILGVTACLVVLSYHKLCVFIIRHIFSF